MRGARAQLAAVALAVLCFNAGHPDPAQAAQSTNAVITGNIVDASGGVLPGITITATNDETGLVRTVVTGERGAYQINALPPGSYTVKAELTGFAPQTRPRIVLAIGATVSLNFTMKMANLTEAVTVTAVAPLVDATTSQISTSISPRDVDQLPLVGRRFMDLALLAPGVSVDNTTLSAPSDNVAFGGFGKGYKAIFLEGMDVNDEDTRGGTAISNASRHTFTQEAAQEFQVLSTAYSAEFGRSGTGVINILTKSGTNQFHGRGFYFIRDGSFDKPNALAHGNPPFREQQSGGTIGGPIRRDKVWFFATYENQNLHDEVTVNVPAFVLPIITDPRTDIPVPSLENNFFAKVTSALSPTEYLNVVGLFGRQTNSNRDVGGTTAGDGGDNQIQHDEFMNATLTSVFTNNLTNSLQFAASYAVKTRPPNGPISPEVDFPSISYGTHTNFFQGREQRNLTLNETLNIHHETRWGTHDFKLGGMLNFVHLPDAHDDTIHGQFKFLQDQIPVPGQPGTYPYFFQIKTPNAPLQLYPNNHAVFGEDAWRPISNLTITVGVRYDVELFNDDNAAALPTDIPTNQFLVRFVSGTLPHVNDYVTWPNDLGDVAPRVSVTWDPSKNGRTVVRSGFGVYYDRWGTNTVSGIIDAYPLGTTRTYANDVRVSHIPNTFFPNIPDLSQLSTVGSTSVDVPNPAGGYMPFTKQSSIGVNHQIGPTMSVSVDYLHLVGLHFPMTYNVNARLPNLQYPLVPSGTTMLMVDPSGHVQTDEVQFAVNQRLAHNLSFRTSYTYLRSYQNQSDPVDKQHIFLNNWGPGPNDVRHRFVFSGAYTLPYNVELSAIVTATSAPPYTIITGSDDNGDKDVNDRPIVNGVMIPPNSARGDRFSRTDMRISRRFRFSNRSLEVLWEMNNLFNTVNYGGYVGNMRSVTFGLPTFALTPFQGQIGLRLDF